MTKDELYSQIRNNMTDIEEILTLVDKYLEQEAILLNILKENILQEDK